jgi:molybdate transport system substrate-binding protein
LAIANPKLAPYGAAAQTVLRRLGVLETLSQKLVYGQNIAQTFQFVATGNAAIGLVALSQMKQDETNRFWVVPAALYNPIRQDVVLLRRGRDNAAAVAFMQFLRGDAARPILQSFGYAKRSVR